MNKLILCSGDIFEALCKYSIEMYKVLQIKFKFKKRKPEGWPYEKVKRTSY